MKFPLLLRAALVAFIAVALLLPVGLIKGKVAERQARATGVVQQFANETSRAQVVAGPFLAASCEEAFQEERHTMRNGKAETITETKALRCPTTYFTPKHLKAVVTMPVESRNRGIYPIRLYRAEVHLTGEFEWPAAASPRRPTGSREWKSMYVVMAVSDARGIKLVKSSLTPALLAATDDKVLSQFAIREDLGDFAKRAPGSRLAFDYAMTLVGTSSLQVAPVGDTTEIRIGSDWPHPSFTEAWTPDTRRVGDDGFEATWRITSLATGGQAAWNTLIAADKLASAGAAGVSLFDPVNIYSLSYRATEYAFLFILFTFAALALAEALAGVNLHPVQYALVGSAVAVFFLLLIAISEHATFAQAYTAAAAACIGLLTFYLRHPLGTRRRTAAFLALFIALYGGLYGLLKSEDNALLLGSLMVFGLLAVAMVATRKVEWSRLSAQMQRARADPAAPAGATANS